MSPGGIIDPVDPGMIVHERDPVTGRPTAITHSDPNEVERRTYFGWPAGAWTTRPEKIQPFPKALGLRPSTLTDSMEISALKSALLTFDHVLVANPQERFTRFPELATVRAFINAAVMRREVDKECLRHLLLGIQYEDITRIEEFRTQYPREPTDFEHVLVAAGSDADRTLDLIWLVAGVDPFRFRVCTSWPGGDLAILAGCGVFRGDSSFGPIIRRTRFPVGPRTDICTHPVTSYASRQHREERVREFAHEITERRFAAVRKAIFLEDMGADVEVLKVFLTNDVRVQDPGDHNAAMMASTLKRRLITSFEDRLIKEDSFIDASLVEEISRFPASLRQQMIDLSRPNGGAVDWPGWIELYRRVLVKLVKRYGYPGVFSDNGCTIA